MSANNIVFLIMPFSFTGFSSAALLLMVLFLAAAQGIKYLRQQHKTH